MWACYVCPSAMCARMYVCMYVHVCLSLCHVCTYARMLCACMEAGRYGAERYDYARCIFLLRAKFDPCMYVFYYECGPATFFPLPCVHVCVYACMHVRACLFVLLPCVQVCMHVCMCVRACIFVLLPCVHVCTHVLMCVYVCLLL